MEDLNASETVKGGAKNTADLELHACSNGSRLGLICAEKKAGLKKKGGPTCRRKKKKERSGDAFGRSILLDRKGD